MIAFSVLRNARTQKRQPPRQQFVQHDPEAEDVTPVVDILAARLLG